VKALADQLGLPFFTRELALSAGPGIEARARAARYQALEEMRVEADMAVIATAHTASDQAETVVMRLARGSALRGASAIRAKRGAVIRPMLSCTRKDVEGYLAEQGVAFVSDPMNVDRTYLRTRVRLDVLPVLEQAAGPEAVHQLARFAQLAAEDDAYLERLAREALQKAAVHPGQLDRAQLLALDGPVLRRVLVSLAEQAGAQIDGAALERSLEALARGGTCTLSQGVELRCESGRVRCVATGSVRGCEAQELVEGVDVFDACSGVAFRVGREVGPSTVDQNLTRTAMTSTSASGLRSVGTVGADDELALCDVPMPLRVRHRKAGDRVGTGKLQDLLVDAKVPREQRDRVPLVCDANDRILWVVGFWKLGEAFGRTLFVQAHRGVGPLSAERPGSL
jgi:tRNA(Ile)-lysidine synthase